MNIVINLFVQKLYKTNMQTEVFTSWSEHHTHSLIGVTQQVARLEINTEMTDSACGSNPEHRTPRFLKVRDAV